MSMAIDQPHRCMCAITPVHDRNSGGIEEDARRRANRYPQGSTHQRLDRPDMRDKHNALIGMSQRKLLYAGTNTLLHGYHALPARRRKRWVKSPLVEQLSVFRTARQHFSAIHPLPYAETALAQRIAPLNREAVLFSHRQRRLPCPLHGAAIDRRDGKPCQRLSQLRRLHLPMLAEWIVTRANKTIFAIGKRFAVPGNEEASGGQVFGSFTAFMSIIHCFCSRRSCPH